MAFAATFAVLFTANAQADTVAFISGRSNLAKWSKWYFGWKNSIIDFNLKKEQQINYFVTVEHLFPLLPNARVSSTSLYTTGKTTLTQEFSFGGETFSAGDDVDVSFNVSYVDYTLYYQLFDSGLS